MEHRLIVELKACQSVRDEHVAQRFGYRKSSPVETGLLVNSGVTIRWEGWHPRGLEYSERLADILNREVVGERDRFFHAMLKPLGIEKGKPFEPNERQKKILTEAVLVGEAMANANDFFNPRLEQSHYHEGSHREIADV